MAYPAPEEVLDTHPTQATEARHNNDRKLRRNNFSIHARPTKGQALWIKGGKILTEKQALKLCTEAL